MKAGIYAVLLALARQGLLQLILRHRGTTFDAAPLRFVVELFLRAALRTASARTLSPALARGHVSGGASARGLGFTRPGAFLVHGGGGDPLGRLRRPALFLGRVLDVLVLPLAFVAPGSLRHTNLPSVACPQ